MAWDASFKNILKYFLPQISDKTEGLEIITETDVPTANLRIDFLIKHEQVLDYPFTYCNKEIVGEFKSERDIFNVEELHRSIAKSYLHVGKSSTKSTTLCYIVGGRPDIPRSIEEEYNIEHIDSGIFRLTHDLDIVVILLDQLTYTPRIQFLGLFAGSEVRRETIRSALLREESFITSVAYFLHEQEVIAVAESENIELDPTSVSIKSAVEAIGLARVIEEVGLARVIEEVGLARVIEEVGVARVIEELGIEKVFNSLTEEQKSKLRDMLNS